MRIVVLTGVVSLATSLIPSPSFAGPAELEEIRRGCATQIGSRCECIVQQAASLGDKEQAYVAAMFAQDLARLQALVMTMSETEMTNATGFFQSSSVACTRAN